jgi:acetyl esterase
MSFTARVRRAAGAFVVDNFFRLGSAAGRLHPLANPERHRVELIPDIPYRETGLAEHRLDIYRPRDGARPLPVVLYVHGGGFRILSKESHWIMALAFARRGFLVFNISYRLAPRHPYPAAIADACAALSWLADEAPRYGGDLSRLILAGESAGANLVTGLTIAAAWRRHEPWARDVYERGLVPRAVMAACGMLQVSDPGRFTRKRRLSAFFQDRVHEVHDEYLGGYRPARPEDLDLADPLCFLERAERPERPLPAFFAPCGTADVLLDDTRRLDAAVRRLGGTCLASYYPGEPHAFHAFVLRQSARRCWADCFAFLDQHL